VFQNDRVSPSRVLAGSEHHGRALREAWNNLGDKVKGHKGLRCSVRTMQSLLWGIAPSDYKSHTKKKKKKKVQRQVVCQHGTSGKRIEQDGGSEAVAGRRHDIT